MSGTTPALLAAAAGVAVGHAVLPDHWVPLAVLGRARRYPLARVARLSLLAGIAHVLVSILLGGAIVAVGLQFRSSVQSAEATIIGAILMLTGAGFAVLHITGHGHRHDGEHGHDHHHHGHEHAGAERHDPHDAAERHDPHEAAELQDPPGARGGVRGLAAVMVPFGAAASPDLTILPVFLAATTAGVATAVGSLLIFAAVTIATIVGLTLLACYSGYQVHGHWLDRWGNALTALSLIVIGALVLAEVI